jgi:hypothetical protein
MREMMVSCRKKDDTQSFHDEGEFKDMVRQHKDQLEIIELLIKYLPDAKQKLLGNIEAFRKYIYNEKPSYHTQSYARNGNYEENFFQSFTYEDFTYSLNLEDDVPLQLFPTDRLSIFNEGLSNEPSMDDLFKKLPILQKLHAKVKKGFVMERKLLTPTDYIRRLFLKSWELQADGHQMNATMQMSSIAMFTERLIEQGIVAEKTVFLDCGSSYGSFLWFLSQHWKEVRNLKLLGIKYSDLRHVLGCHATYHMFRKAQSNTSRLDGELLTNVILQHRNLQTMSSFVGSPTIVFMFDKAFNWELCFHVLLCALATPSVMYLISCKGSFKIYANCGVTLRFNHLIEKTEGFEELFTISDLKMNGKGEAAGDFTIFRRTNKMFNEASITSAIDGWLEGCADTDKEKVLSCYTKAWTTVNQDLPSLNTYEDFLAYYANEGCPDKLKKIARNKSKSVEGSTPMLGG